MISVTIWITYKCNLRCKYCYENNRFATDNEETVQYNEIINFVKYIADANPRDEIIINFHGGEPLLFFDRIKDFVELLSTSLGQRDIYFGITTNGTLLNEEIIRYLNEKFNEISVSIDGIKRVHDKYRISADGRGSYDKIITNLNKSAIDKEKIRIRMTLTSYGVPFFYDSVCELYKKGYKYIVPAIAVNDPGWSEEKFEQLYGGIKELINNGFSDLKFLQKLLEDKKPFSPCAGGIKTFNIGCDNNVYPCEYVVGIKKFSLGNLSDYKDVLCNGVKRNKSYLAMNKRDCQECSYKEYCEAERCKLYNYINSYDLLLPSDNQCQVEHLKYRVWRDFVCHSYQR